MGKGKVHKFFAQFDMFAAQPTLRAKQEPQSSSIFSGMLSILFGFLFAYVFINSAVGVFTYNDIQSLQTQSKLSGNQVKAKQIFFAVRSGYLSASESLKYFDIGYNIITEDGQNISQTLTTCQKEQWTKLGEKYEQEFDQYQMSQFFCPNPETNLSLYRVYYAQNPRFITVYIKPCSGRPDCQNQTAHRQFVQKLTDQEGATFLLIYFLDDVLNPQSKQPVSFTINTDVELAFTTKRGIIATVQFGSYKIETDMGFMPIQQKVTHQGNFVHSFRQTSIQLKNYEDNYALIYLYMNRRYINMQRKVGKIDEMLSYAGGLFSILIGFLAIFMNSFNQYRYELMVAEGVFNEDEEGNRIREDDFTFFKYVKYTIFDWIQTLFCCTIKWHDCILIDNTREQANCQLDVTRLFRKIQTMDNSILHVINRGQKDCLALVKPESLGKIKRNRLILEYYEAIVQGKQVLTIQQYIMSKKILRFGLWLAKTHDHEGGLGGSVANSNSNSDNLYDQNSDHSVDLEQIQDKDQLLSAALHKFKQIQIEAQLINLSEELLQIQQSLAQEFCDLEYEARIKIQQKIPIIILQRLKKHVDMQSMLKVPQKPQKTVSQTLQLKPVKPSRSLRDCPLIVEFQKSEMQLEK